jgi:hypothetical protein
MPVLILAARAVFAGLGVYAVLLVALAVASVPATGGMFGGLVWILIVIILLAAGVLVGAGRAGFIALRAAGIEPAAARPGVRAAAVVAAAVGTPVACYLVLDRNAVFALPLAVAVPPALAITVMTSPNSGWTHRAMAGLALLTAGALLLVPGTVANTNANQLRYLRMSLVTRTSANEIVTTIRDAGRHPVGVYGMAAYWGPDQVDPWPMWGIGLEHATRDVLDELTAVGSPQVRFVLGAQCIGTREYVISTIELELGQASFEQPTIVTVEGDPTVTCDGAVQLRRFAPVDLTRGLGVDRFAALRIVRDAWVDNATDAVRWVLLAEKATAQLDEQALARVVTAAFGSDLR